MARSQKAVTKYPTETEAQDYVRSKLPEASARKRKGINGVWDVFACKGAQVPLTYGFTLAEARQEAALLLGYKGGGANAASG